MLQAVHLLHSLAPSAAAGVLRELAGGETSSSSAVRQLALLLLGAQAHVVAASTPLQYLQSASARACGGAAYPSALAGTASAVRAFGVRAARAAGHAPPAETASAASSCERALFAPALAIVPVDALPALASELAPL
jgi:hypothetical protein